MRGSNLRRLTDRALRLVAAAILFQTLYFKFTGAPESVYIFSTLHMEPWGRLGSAVAELAAGVLLLLPATAALGALAAAGVMGGAILSHLTILGIEVEGDGGLLFGLAVAVLAASLGIAWLRRTELPFLGYRLALDRRHRRHGPSSIAAQTSCRHVASGDGRSGKRVLILGGGFGGVYTALELERALRWDDEVEVTLVNRDNFFLFTPMLHEVAASDLDLTNIVSPIRKMLRRVDFFEGEAIEVDLGQRRATLRHGSDRHNHVVRYDALVLGLGSAAAGPGRSTSAWWPRPIGSWRTTSAKAASAPTSSTVSTSCPCGYRRCASGLPTSPPSWSSSCAAFPGAWARRFAVSLPRPSSA